MDGLLQWFPKHHLTVVDSENNTLLHVIVKQLFLSWNCSVKDNFIIALGFVFKNTPIDDDSKNFLYAFDAHGDTVMHVLVKHIAQGNGTQRKYALRALQCLLEAKMSPQVANIKNVTVVQSATHEVDLALKKEQAKRMVSPIAAALNGIFFGYASDDLAKAIAMMSPAPTKTMVAQFATDQEQRDFNKPIFMP